MPLAVHAKVWEAIPGASEWVLSTVREGYSLQFARRPPRFRTRTETKVNGEVAHLLCAGIAKLLCKGAIEPVHPSLSESGFYSGYFLVPKKDGALRTILDLRYLNKALMKRPFKTLTTRQILAQIRPRDWFISPRSDRRLLSDSDNTLSQAILEIRLQRSGISIHRSAVRPVFSTLYIQVHGHGFRSPERSGHADFELFGRLADSSTVRGRTYLSQNSASQPPGKPGSHGQLDQKLITAQSVNLFSGFGTGLCGNDSPAVDTIRRLAASFQLGSAAPLKTFQRMLGCMASAAAVLQLGLLRMRPLQRWLNARVPHRAWASGGIRLQRGVTMGAVSTKNQEKCLHINCLEIIVIENALKRFLPYIRDHHVLVRSDNMSMVSYVNRQGGVRSRNLGAVHVPGHLNVGPDRLSRDNIPPGEWFLHPQTVQLLWHLFGRAEVNLFGSKDNAHCPTFFSKSEDVLAQTWPSRPLYAFPPISLLPQIFTYFRVSTPPPVLLPLPPLPLGHRSSLQPGLSVEPAAGRPPQPVSGDAKPGGKPGSWVQSEDPVKRLFTHPPADPWRQVSVAPHNQTPLQAAPGPSEPGPCPPPRCPTSGMSVVPLVPLARFVEA
ncbi:hypothetical protein PO909_004541 [Leuciscus waleckii]